MYMTNEDAPSGQQSLLSEGMTLEEAVFTSLGGASTCWVGGTGSLEFDGERAKEIGEELVDWLRKHYVQEMLDDLSEPGTVGDEVAPPVSARDHASKLDGFEDLGPEYS